MTMAAFSGMLKLQPLVEAVMVIVTSHSPQVSRLLCKLNLLIYLKIDEVGGFFKKSTKEALWVILEVIKATRMTDCGLGLSSACNAVRKTAEKLLLFCKRNRNDNWNVLLTIDLGLNVEQAYRIYATRWSIEVYFKEGKQLLNLGGCQSRAFNAQVAAATIVMLQYGILSVAKRFASYETPGALFRDTGADVLELTLNERLWVYICQVVSKLAELFGLDEEKSDVKIDS